jgi:hypothetical protein
MYRFVGSIEFGNSYPSSFNLVGVGDGLGVGVIVGNTVTVTSSVGVSVGINPSSAF